MNSMHVQEPCALSRGPRVQHIRALSVNSVRAIQEIGILDSKLRIAQTDHDLPRMPDERSQGQAVPGSGREAERSLDLKHPPQLVLSKLWDASAGLPSSRLIHSVRHVEALDDDSRLLSPRVGGQQLGSRSFASHRASAPRSCRCRGPEECARRCRRPRRRAAPPGPGSAIGSRAPFAGGTRHPLRSALVVTTQWHLRQCAQCTVVAELRAAPVEVLGDQLVSPAEPQTDEVDRSQPFRKLH